MASARRNKPDKLHGAGVSSAVRSFATEGTTTAAPAPNEGACREARARVDEQTAPPWVPRLLLAACFVGVLVLAGSCGSLERTGSMPPSAQGARLFAANCVACHGISGAGLGRAAIALKVRPRDLRHEAFRYISTLDGTAADEDLVQTIRHGRPAGEMPASPWLTDAQIRVLADYVREIQRLGWIERLTDESSNADLSAEEITEIAAEMVSPSASISISPPGPKFRSNTHRGEELYVAACASCHGRTGRGDALDRPLDDSGRPIAVRDLTTGRFRGGSHPDELFKRIRCGIPGTPMPAQLDLSDDEIWQLVHYVKFLAGGNSRP